MFFNCNNCNNCNGLSRIVSCKGMIFKTCFFCVFFEDLFGSTMKYLYLCIVERKDQSAGH